MLKCYVSFSDESIRIAKWSNTKKANAHWFEFSSCFSWPLISSSMLDDSLVVLGVINYPFACITLKETKMPLKSGALSASPALYSQQPRARQYAALTRWQRMWVPKNTKSHSRWVLFLSSATRDRTDTQHSTNIKGRKYVEQTNGWENESSQGRAVPTLQLYSSREPLDSVPKCKAFLVFD